MVLRRTLPSRLTGASPAAPASVPTKAETAPNNSVTTPPAAPVLSAAAEQAAALAAAMQVVVAAPEPKLQVSAPAAPMDVAQPVQLQDAPVFSAPVVTAPAAAPMPLAAAAVVAPEAPAPSSVDAGFTAPPTAARRVLEDSFAAPAVAIPEPAVATAPMAPAVLAPAALVPAEPASVPTTEPAAVQPLAAAIAAEPPTPPSETTPPATEAETIVNMAAPEAPAEPAAVAQGPTDFLNDNPFAATQAGQVGAVASRPADNPLRRRVPKGPSQPLPPRPKQVAAPLPPAAVREDVAAAPVGIPAPEPAAPAVADFAATAATAATPAAFAPLTAKATRKTTVRDFAAATIVPALAGAQAVVPAALNLAPEIPVDTRPLDKVDEELIASGIIAGPAADSLTSAVPSSMAVAEEAMPQDFMASAPPTAGSPAPFDLPSFTLATAPLAHTPSGPLAALPNSQSGWDVEPAAPTPPPDIFKPVAGAATPAALGPLPSGFEAPTAAGMRVPPPTLPEGRPSRVQLMNAGRPGKSWLGSAVALVALVGVGVLVWNRTTAPGGLDAASQQIARLTQPRATVLPATENGQGLLPPPTQIANGFGPTGNAQIEFAPPAADPNAPIMAQGSEAMPDDISLFARLQREVAAARAEREGKTSVTVESTATAAVPSTPLTKEQSDAELAEYRRLLAEGTPTTAPKPREFLRDPEAFMDGKNPQAAALPEGALLPPPATRGEAAGQASSAALPPPNELYTNNPRGLPIVAEPQMQEAPRIRQLNEFAAELFPQDEPRVKVPQGLRPRMAATEFPSLEVLSFVPGRGLIATANGQEGVLMLGESIDGWELTSVSSDMAEFKAGGRSYVLTPQN